ncbi:MAG: hypothetical protein GWO20_04225 [Candidatus Korarchaeota archaeon]|nr:hypothetical protein [Candidatus Korarchaeota archaeon]
MKVVTRRKFSEDGWQLTSNKGEEYDIKFFLGKVKKGDMDGNLLIIWKLYIIWKFI